MAKNKKITIDGLAVMIQKEFGNIHQDFGKVNQRLDNIDRKLEGMVYRNEFDKLQGRVETLENLLAMKK